MTKLVTDRSEIDSRLKERDRARMAHQMWPDFGRKMGGDLVQRGSMARKNMFRTASGSPHKLPRAQHYDSTTLGVFTGRIGGVMAAVVAVVADGDGGKMFRSPAVRQYD